ncbi:hypothetical protein JCM8097_004453 [Rhodosporidiobolus ruineniae]
MSPASDSDRQSLDTSKRVPPLPVELVQHILEDVVTDAVDRGYQRTLARCCVVSKSFASLAVPLLFHHIRLRGRDLYSATLLSGSPRPTTLQHVRHLELVDLDLLPTAAGFDSESVLGLLQHFTQLEIFEVEERPRSWELRALLPDAIATWRMLKQLRLSHLTIDHAYLRHQPDLQVLQLHEFSSTSEVECQVPFGLRQLTISSHTEPRAFTHLTRLSSSTLTSLCLSIVTLDHFDLTPFHGIRDLRLSFPTRLPSIGYSEFDLAILLLRSVPHVTCLILDTEYDPPVSGQFLVKKDFFNALPPSLVELYLDAVPPPPPRYLANFLSSRDRLSQLERLACSYQASETASERAERLDNGALIAYKRPQLAFEWRNRRPWTDA